MVRRTPEEARGATKRGSAPLLVLVGVAVIVALAFGLLV